MEFYSRSNYPKTIPAPTCEAIIPEFALETDSKGRTNLVKQKIGTNIYDKIQAAKDSTMIDNIIKRFYEGDTTILQKMQGQFGNFTNMPTTLAEAQQKIIDAEEFFNKQPIEFKQKFGMDPRQFLAAAGNGMLKKMLGIEEKITTSEEIIKQLQEENAKLKEKSEE